MKDLASLLDTYRECYLYGHKQRIYQRITGNKPDKPQDVNALIAALKSKKKRFGNWNNP